MTLREKFLPRMYCFFGSGMLSNTYDDKIANQNAFECEQISDEFAIEFAEWYSSENVMENAEKYPNYTIKDMLKLFKKEKGL